MRCFFFSSRRRHTRWTGDWSSDVCSSDLGMIGAEVAAIAQAYVSKLVMVAPVGLWLDEHPVMDFFAATAEELATAIFHDPGSPIAREMTALPSDPDAQLEA